MSRARSLRVRAQYPAVVRLSVEIGLGTDRPAATQRRACPRNGFWKHWSGDQSAHPGKTCLSDDGRLRVTEEQFCFVGIVGTAPQLDILFVGATTSCVREHVMKLQKAAFTAPAP